MRYSFKTDKLRGFINSSYDFNSNLAWSALFILALMGIFFIYKNTLDYVNFEKIYSSFNVSVILLLILGLLGSNFPLINFINYYYFGQQKYGITLNNPLRQMYMIKKLHGEEFSQALNLLVKSLHCF